MGVKKLHRKIEGITQKNRGNYSKKIEGIKQYFLVLNSFLNCLGKYT